MATVNPHGIHESDRPMLKEINNYGIRDGVATNWYDLGVQLLPDDKQVHLDIIRNNNPTDTKACCTCMFEYWLEVDTTASWSKLIEALKKIKKYRIAEYISREVWQDYVTAEQKKSLFVQEILHYLLKARENGCCVKVRYGKVLICGANAAGKTNFLNLLMEENFQEEHISTGVTDSRQVKAFKAEIQTKHNKSTGTTGSRQAKVEDKEEVYFKKISIEDERTELLSHLPPVTESKTCFNKVYGYIFGFKNKVKEYCTKTETMIATKDANASDKKRNRLENIQQHDEKAWNILTFIDTGGQPHLISMLPAVNSFAMTTFIVHNMTKDLDDDVEIIQDGEVMSQSYGYKHRQLIITLASYASSIVLPDIQFLNAFKALNTSNKGKTSTSISILGTHSHIMKENAIHEIDTELTKMFEHSVGLKKILKPRLNQNYEYLIPVDNDEQGISLYKDKSKVILHTNMKYTAPSIIRSYLYNQLEDQDVYEVPLNWLILELEIRRKCIEKNCFLITLKDVLKLGKDKKLGNKNDILNGLRFHHLFGVLLYFEKVKGMQKLVITNHQWLFDKLTKFSDYMRHIYIDFESKEDKSKFSDYMKHKVFKSEEDREIFKLKGIFKESMIDINELSIREDFKNSGTNAEPKKSFLQLLEYLRFIAPHENAGEYFMPTVLPSFELANLRGKSVETNKTNFTEPLLIQYKTGDKSGSFPRGFFCFLAVQLKILKKPKWDLPEKKQAYNNLLTFCNKPSGHHISLIDRISFLEIQVTHDKDISPIHNEVFDVICNALTEVGCKFNVNNPLNYGFWCKSCPEQNEVHMTYPYISNEEEKLESCQHCYCTHGARTDLEDAHKIWFKESIKQKCVMWKTTLFLVLLLFKSLKECMGKSKKRIILIAFLLALSAYLIESNTGLQDASPVLNSTYQKEPIGNEPKPTTQGLSKEYEVFKKYYYNLSIILPTKNIIDKLISKEIITRGDREEIDGVSRLQDKTSKVLGIVDTALEAGYTDHFYSLLTIMEEYGGVVTKLANEIRESLK